MTYIFNLITSVLIDRNGVSSLEYAILAVSIIAAVAAAVTALAGPLSTAFLNIGNSL